MLDKLRSRFRNFMTRWTSWVMEKSNHKHAAKSLFTLAFIESIFFPIPPDVLLVSMSASNTKRSLYYAFLTTLGSVLGAVVGYAIGYLFYDSLGVSIINMLNLSEKFQTAGVLFSKYDFLIIFAAAFTPIPYKVFTLSAGLWHISFASFIFASIVGRGLRFYIQGLLFYFYGPKIKKFIKKNIELLSIVIFLLIAVLILAFSRG